MKIDLNGLTMKQLRELSNEIQKKIESEKHKSLKTASAQIKSLKADVRTLTRLVTKEYSVSVPVRFLFTLDIGSDGNPLCTYEDCNSDSVKWEKDAEAKLSKEFTTIKTLNKKIRQDVKSLAKKYDIDESDLWQMVDEDSIVLW